MKKTTSCRAALVRSVSAVVAVAMLVPWRAATGAPGDIFTTAAPAIGDSAPAATALADGESGVSTNTGAFTYTYPIEVPPGRNGLKPNIGLSYSSQAPIYGGIAAGWSLSGLPIITEDTNGGRLYSTAVPTPPLRFQSSLAGNRPLIPVTEPAPSGAITYRGQNDGSFFRYERYQSGDYWWRVLSPDGTKYFFGHKDATHISTCTTVSASYAPITRIEDPLGNLMDFFYQAGVDGECRILAIAWGQSATASIGPFAALVFTYETAPQCNGVPVGEQTSYRTGTKIVTGGSKLKTIKAIAVEPSAGTPGGIAPPPVTPPLHTRTITLDYESATESCAAPHAPYRTLKSLQESAVGTDPSLQVNLPAIAFTYGSAEVDYGGPGSAVVTPVPWQASWLGGNQPGVHNLGWGHRPNDGWPTVEAMMLDVDGDGLIDRIQSEPEIDLTTGRARFCRARWYRNRGVGSQNSDQFQLAGDINLPTLKWATPVGQPGGVYAGGDHAGDDPSLGVNERCALNYQRTAYHNSTVGFLTTCPPGATTCPDAADGVVDGIGVCPTTHSDCGVNKAASADTHFAWRWMDIDGDSLPDLVGSPVTGGVGSYDLQWGNAQVPLAPQEPAIFGAFPGCPSPSFTGSGNWGMDQYTMCHGMFPWFVYRNHGNGVFGQPRPGGSGSTHATWGPLPDDIIYQPIPLESANGDSSVTSKPVGQYEGTIDIDGDGFADAVQVYHQSANQWKVFRNDGSGRLLPSGGSTPYAFETNFWLYLSRTDYTPTPSPAPVGVEGLEDLNGDGLVDQWRVTANPAMAAVHYNDGVKLRASGALPVADRPGSDAHSTVTTGTGAPFHHVCVGRRDDSRRTRDLDQDGRADILAFNGSTISAAQFNFGGRFGSPNLQLGPGALHTIQVRTDNDAQPCDAAGWWETLSDLVDLDGDGIEEDVLFTSISGPPDQMQVRYPANTAGQRLLTSINNGRGAITSVTYNSMNGAAVTQTPAQNKASPATNWVVQRVSTTDSFASTTNASTYKYKNPRWAPDLSTIEPSRSSFRGFEEVETTSQSGAVTIERFSYSPDWSGRLATKIVKPGSGTSVHTIDDTTWEEFPLFNGAITTYHATAADHWTCKNNQSETACRANVDTRTRTATEWTTLTSTSTTDPTPLLWQAETELLQAGAAPAFGDRGTTTTFALYSDASSYRLRQLTSTKLHVLIDGSAAMYGKSASTWDPVFGTKLTEEVWVDTSSDPTKHLIERWAYDPVTHNVTEHWKPKQNAAGTTRTTFVYDSRQLFVALETNELGHQTSSAYDYGTGAKLLTEGPNQRSCTSGCPSVSQQYPLKEQERVRVDGLGRVVERYETVSPDGAVFTSYLAETNAYVDNGANADPPVANSTTNRLLVDETGSTWREQKTEIDGHGRPIKTTVLAQGTAPANHVTTYAYRNEGTLQSVSVPDPSLNSASLVTFTYAFDTLGRPLTLRRPDSTTPSNQSGVNIAYDGLTQTTTEVVGSAGGQIGETQTINDRFGRLSQVKEKTGASTYATTTYSYGPDDFVSTIVDPSGVTTNLAHDFAGRRTQITRSSRVWKYGYDKNGNMVSEQVPGSTGPGTDLDFTTFTAYDDLDRPASKVIGKRNLAPAEQDLFISNTETFTYDIGRLGALQYWRAYGSSPNSCVNA